ncbi:MAG TPA: hypothetical protein VGL34_25930 [Steroidobacteraceae bacterium]
MKLPFEFGVPLIFRLVLPGTIFALLTYHTTHTLFAVVLDQITSEALIAFQSIIYGWLIVISDMQIYMLFEGRRYWPDWLERLFLRDERNYLAVIRRKIKNGRQGPRSASAARNRVERTNRIRLYREAGVDARAFPIDEQSGGFDAGLPTRLGNILLAFEGYSERVYGLDAVFYWPRLWSILDKDIRAELSTAQAMTDSAVYISFVLYLGGLINLIQYVIEFYGLGQGTAEVSGIGLLGGTCLALAYLIYRCSLRLQVTFGEQFKAVFDVFGDKIDLKLAKQVLASPLGEKSPREANQIIWRYLHNYRVKDPDFRIPKRPAAWSRKYGRLDAAPSDESTGSRFRQRWVRLIAWIARGLR